MVFSHFLRLREHDETYSIENNLKLL